MTIAPSAAAPTATFAHRSHPARTARTALWAGRVVSAIPVLFLAFDAIGKVSAMQVAVEGTKELGYPVEVLVPLGVVQLVCLALYLVPRTAILGAVLWTGYLGGAVATHVRMSHPWATHILFPVFVAAFLWAGLWLRDRRARMLLARPAQV
ncbi:MAG: DoxX family protein [Polyangiales bacterium]